MTPCLLLFGGGEVCPIERHCLPDCYLMNRFKYLLRDSKEIGLFHRPRLSPCEIALENLESAMSLLPKDTIKPCGSLVRYSASLIPPMMRQCLCNVLWLGGVCK